MTDRSAWEQQPPLTIIARHLHAYRGHDTRRYFWGRALSSGGMSLIGPDRCSCERDAEQALTALLDAGCVVVTDDELLHE